MATAHPCSGSRRNPSLPASGECWWQPLKCLDHTLPAPCPASSRRKVQFLLIRCREWPKYFVNFLAQKGNEATSVSVHWHRSKLNNWEICFRGEIQSTYFLDFTLPLEAELCLFLPLFQAGWTLLHKKWEGWGRASRLFCRLASGSSCQTKSYIGKHFLVYTKTINCLMCKVKPESYSHKFTLKSTFLLALSKRNLHTGSTVRFFGLSSKSSFCHSSLTSSLLVPGWKASQRSAEKWAEPLLTFANPISSKRELIDVFPRCVLLKLTMQFKEWIHHGAISFWIQFSCYVSEGEGGRVWYKLQRAVTTKFHRVCKSVFERFCTLDGLFHLKSKIQWRPPHLLLPSSPSKTERHFAVILNKNKLMRVCTEQSPNRKKK